MPLMPKRVKHRKIQRGSIAGLARKCNKLDFGEYGLQALDRTYITNNEIEAARVAINRHLKRRRIVRQNARRRSESAGDGRGGGGDN